MKFERIIEGKDHLWAVRDMSKEVNELTELMEDKPHTQMELDKLNSCRQYLIDNKAFDQDSFTGLKEENEDEI